MIIADSREKNSLVLAELIEKKHEIKIEQLNFGDYIIGDIAIERKTLNDFISSMLSKRLIEQLQNMKQFPKQLLILEGEEKRINIHPNAVRGMILSISLDFNIPIIFSKNENETAEFLILLDKKQNKPPTEISLTAKRKCNSIKEQQQIILENFPGIGPSTAKKLLDNFKSLKRIFNSDEKSLIDSGLQEMKAKDLKKIIDWEN
jgi:Fanconi anemia group M protein